MIINDPKKNTVFLNIFLPNHIVIKSISRIPKCAFGTLNSHRAASPLVRLGEGEERWEIPDPPQCVLPQNWVGIEKNRTITCMVLKATANDRCRMPHCHDEFHGPPFGLCQSGGISNNNNKTRTVDPRDVIYMKTRLRTPSKDQSSKDRHIVTNAPVRPTASSTIIQAKIAPSLGAPVSSRTIQRRLAEGHLGSRRPLSEWNQVVFRDESRFNLSSDGNRVRVWRPHGESSILPLLYNDTTLTASVIVWSVIAYNIRLLLVLIRGTMTSQWYVHDILQPHVLPLLQRLPGAIFQQDNARPHKARVSQDCLRTVISLLDPQICLQSRISGIFWDGELGIRRI
ncbi:transposable element Tcb2 transposase [Trichonephila clavipes]|nr:transposable element Tcb2 transposase [Trichonephila clavipes]